jgi:hypothetical protein
MKISDWKNVALIRGETVDHYTDCVIFSNDQPTKSFANALPVIVVPHPMFWNKNSWKDSARSLKNISFQELINQHHLYSYNGAVQEIQKNTNRYFANPNSDLVYTYQMILDKSRFYNLSTKQIIFDYIITNV